MGRKLTLETDSCMICVELYEWNGISPTVFDIEELFRDVLRGLGYGDSEADEVPDFDEFYDSTLEDE